MMKIIKIFILLMCWLVPSFLISDCAHSSYRVNDDPFVPKRSSTERSWDSHFQGSRFGDSQYSHIPPSEVSDANVESQGERPRSAQVRWADCPDYQNSNLASRGEQYDYVLEGDSDTESEDGLLATICNKRIIFMITPLVLPLLLFMIYFIIITTSNKGTAGTNSTVSPFTQSTTHSNALQSSSGVATASVAAAGKRKKRSFISNKNISHNEEDLTYAMQPIFEESNESNSVVNNALINNYETILHPSLTKGVHSLKKKTISKELNTMELEEFFQLPIDNSTIKTFPSYAKKLLVNTSEIKPSNVQAYESN